MMDKATKSTLALFTSTIVYLIGGVDPMVNALCIFIILDFITGVVKSAYLGETNSKVAFLGLIKVFSKITLLVIANQVDLILNFNDTNSNFRNLTVWYLIGIDGISIIENIGTFIPTLNVLGRFFEQIRDSIDNS